ncbi:hypothetical protein E2562_010613 [Oryza meyeriana var. granulata]|uniref:C2H2-type domain-containing protein n=1 Tax=Oryza meyeriana var. granulata TaxID=110450 RepID=A0A6G1BUF7_9ORYZ|nr:hypothetical protein E2562_010613 [Oryza meyeriana var. granulata]
MGVQEEAALAAAVVKGKRSKRQRAHAVVLIASSAAAAATEESMESSLSLSGGAAEAEGSSTTSPSTTRGDEAVSGCVTEEEEDMALCLMLLASGGHGERARGGGDEEVAVAAAKEAKFRSRRPAYGAAAGEFVYECKTCSKCFPSFQALGGHRTSHKKPRLIVPPAMEPPADDKIKPAVSETDATAATEEKQPKPSPPRPASRPTTTDPTVLAIPVIPKQEVLDTTAATAIASISKQPRVHECSICGAEFASGQALGGHMRRHRPLIPASASSVSVLDGVDAPRQKEKSLLELDLNMPAPCDDVAAETTTSATSPAAFAFAVKERSPLLVPAALVGCHY